MFSYKSKENRKYPERAMGKELPLELKQEILLLALRGNNHILARILHVCGWVHYR